MIAGGVWTYACDYDEVGGFINLDLDSWNRLVGVEVLDASKKLPPEIFSGAEAHTLKLPHRVTYDRAADASWMRIGR